MSVSVDGKASSPLKRPRDSSSEAEDDSGLTYQSTPGTGGRYDKDRLVCDQCGLTFRKHSDLKKHNARHSRSYRCIEEGCPRSQIGFATINDLYRHEKSVHGKHVGKSRMYRCFAPGCAKASKLWPRLDNFKQHLIRMHPNEDVDALVKKSEQWHAEEEGETLTDGHSQESVISSLQNVKRLRSPPRQLGAPIHVDGDPLAPSRRWDLTPPTTATIQDRRTDFRQILTGPGGQAISQGPPPPQSNGERPLQPNPNPMQPPAPPPHLQGPPPPPPSMSPSQTDSQPQLNSQNAPSQGPSQPGAPPPHQNSQPPPNADPNLPRLSPSTEAHLSHNPTTVRELTPEARCRSCVWNNRRCFVDSNQPRHCISCRSREECIFRRTVIRDAPADFFVWAEIVGVEHLSLPPPQTQGQNSGPGPGPGPGQANTQ